MVEVGRICKTKSFSNCCSRIFQCFRIGGGGGDVIVEEGELASGDVVSSTRNFNLFGRLDDLVSMINSCRSSGMVVLSVSSE